MIRAIALLAFLLASPTAFADETSSDAGDGFGDLMYDYFIDGASITLGIGGRTVAIDVTRKGSGDHGHLLDTNGEAYFLLYSTKAGYFGRSNIGYSWLLNLSTLNLDTQKSENAGTVDLNTEVNGYFFSAVPTIFYNIGDRYRGHYLRGGIGLGVGVAKFNGDIVLTESSTANDRVTISNGRSNVFLALGVFLDYQWENFTIRLSHSGPNIQYDNYDINVSGSSMLIGYTFYL
jgi:hypothetical protein